MYISIYIYCLFIYLFIFTYIYIYIHILKASGKTVGFVARETKVTMDKFLRVQKDCPVDWDVKRLSSRQAYNVGVVAVNLERWRTDYPKYCLTPREEQLLKFLPMCFPLGVVFRFPAAFAEHITLRPYGQQLLKLF